MVYKAGETVNNQYNMASFKSLIPKIHDCYFPGNLTSFLSAVVYIVFR